MTTEVNHIEDLETMPQLEPHIDNSDTIESWVDPIVLPLAAENGNPPELIEIPRHSKIPNPHGRIFIAVCNFEEPGPNILKSDTQKTLANHMQEAIEQGICFLFLVYSFCLIRQILLSGLCPVLLSNDDSLILRNKYGSGEERDDVVVFTYAHRLN